MAMRNRASGLAMASRATSVCRANFWKACEEFAQPIVSDALPRLRFNLDFMPSPDPAKPGLYIRDPYHYSDSTLLVPPPLVAALECFDGQQSTLDLRSQLVRITGEIEVGDLEKHLFDSLDE